MGSPTKLSRSILVFGLFLTISPKHILTSAESCPTSDQIVCTCTITEEDLFSLDCNNPSKTELEDTFKIIRVVNNMTSSSFLHFEKFQLQNYHESLPDPDQICPSIFNNLVLNNNSVLFLSFPSKCSSYFMPVKTLTILNSNFGATSFSKFTQSLSLQQMTEMIISGNNLFRNIADVTPTNFEHLVSLDLSGNKIVSIEGQDFVKNTKLRKLNLSHNRITTINPKAFEMNLAPEEVDMDAMIEIDLTDNRLTDGNIVGENGLSNMKRPLRLDLSGNKFVYLSKENFEAFLFVDERNEMLLGGNSFVCSDRMRWLQDAKMLLESRVTGVDCINDEGRNVFNSELVQ